MDFKEVYDKIDSVRFSLAMRDNILHVAYIDQVEQFINTLEIQHGKQEERRGVKAHLEE
jgi:hypothetical protein